MVDVTIELQFLPAKWRLFGLGGTHDRATPHQLGTRNLDMGLAGDLDSDGQPELEDIQPTALGGH